MRSLALLVLALLLLAGCGGPGAGQEPLPAEWRGRDLREPGWVNETLHYGWTVAFQYDWPAGKRVAWDWVVTGPIHNQDPIRTVYVHFQLVRLEDPNNPSSARAVVAGDAEEGKDEKTMPQRGTYQLDWSNEWQGGAVTIAIKAPAGGTLILYPPGQGPACLFVPTWANSDPAAGSAGCLVRPASS